MFTEHKIKRNGTKEAETLAVTAGCVRFFKERLKAALRGGVVVVAEELKLS